MTDAAALRARVARLQVEIADTKARIRRSRHHLNNLRASLARTFAQCEALGLLDGEEGEGALHGQQHARSGS